MYQFRDKKKSKHRSSLIRTVILVGVLTLLSVLGFLTWTGRIFHFVGQPVWKAENAALDALHDTTEVIRTKSSVFKENDALIVENADLKASMIDYQIIKKENEDLKELLGRKPVGHIFTIATILTKPNQSPYDTITIDVGSDLGITEGMQVFANGNIPIGAVSTVYGTNSLLVLYSNPAQTTEGILDGSNASVELIGRGGGNFEMSIPLDLPSENGAMVVLPNASTEVLAIVDSVISTPTDPIKKVLLRSPANIQALKWVQIKKD